ncbi:helix-turn-helix domain-containing protein [Angustibacter sp. McL0619]|uniref:helix-turn-helix domain-containing protein n=1 Tax=Angustibacter sp. McL0619 TaxID=3415676 RepID=UPI003CE741CD
MRLPSRTDHPSAPGWLLRRAREQAEISQEELARRAQVCRTVVSRFESGDRPASWPMFQKLLAALDLQARVELEALDAHLRARLDDERARPPMEWFEHDLCFDGRSLARLFSLLPVVADGTLAARLHGLPLPVGDLELLVPPTVPLAMLDEAARASFIYLRDGDDEHTFWSPREDRRLVLHYRDPMPAAVSVSPPWTGRFTHDFDDTCPVAVAALGQLRLKADERRLLDYALSAQPDAR